MNSKSNTGEVVLSTAYLPPIDYFSSILSSSKCCIEQFENYQKQSYRSRCHIYSANGLLSLVIPVLRDNGHSVPVREVKIDYSRKWQQQHWMAIVSAYRMSPFFEYYQDDFEPFYKSQEIEYLFDFNLKLTTMLLNLAGINREISLTDSYENHEVDLREAIHPKRPSLLQNKNGQYHQVFAHKYGFIANLSIVDLLFNEGPDTVSYL